MRRTPAARWRLRRGIPLGLESATGAFIRLTTTGQAEPPSQPGVEDYKKNMFALLGKPGYEAMTADLTARLEKVL